MNVAEIDLSHCKIDVWRFWQLGLDHRESSLTQPSCRYLERRFIKVTSWPRSDQNQFERKIVGHRRVDAAR